MIKLIALIAVGFVLWMVLGVAYVYPLVNNLLAWILISYAFGMTWGIISALTAISREWID